MTPKYLSLEIRFCVEWPHTLVGSRRMAGSIESYETEAERDKAVRDNPSDYERHCAKEFVGLYARVPDADTEALPAGLLQHIADWTEYSGARDMLDVLTGTTEAERAAAGNPLLYVPPAVKPIPQSEGITALCIYEAMMDLSSWGGVGHVDAPKHQLLAECFDGFGAYEMRRKALDITPMCEAAWLALSDDERDDVVHDWEFVPAFVAVTDWTGDEPRFAHRTPAEMARAVLARIEATKTKAEG